VHDVCTGLLDRGIEVQVTCRPSLYLPARDVPLVAHVNAVGADLSAAEIDNPFLGMWRTSRDLAQAENWNEYDVVHLQSHYGYHTALRLARMPGPRPALVSTFHLTAIGGMVRLQELGIPQEPDLLQTQPAAVMEATIAGLSDRLIAVSQQVHDDLTRGYGSHRRMSAWSTTASTQNCSRRSLALRPAVSSGSTPACGTCCMWGRFSAFAETCCWTA